MALISPKNMKKLTRDKVISGTDKGDRVGIYFEGDNGVEILLEAPPKEADEIIKLWNKNAK